MRKWLQDPVGTSGKLSILREPLDVAQKHIVLLKLTYCRDHAPDFSNPRSVDGRSEQTEWLSTIGALLKFFDPARLAIDFRGLRLHMGRNNKYALPRILDCIQDAIEEIRLELELDGKSDVGMAYDPGEVYRYFSDLKKILSGATQEVLVVDPYLNGATFDQYFSEWSEKVKIRLLVDRYAKDLKAYVVKHMEQFGTDLELGISNELHDRIVIVDQEICWISGGSIKDGGRKPAYLIPLAPEIAEKKLRTYNQIWTRANKLNLLDDKNS